MCSVSAFAPISNPSECPWGETAFKGYLAGGVSEGKDLYDATELVKKLPGPATPVHILVDYACFPILPFRTCETDATVFREPATSSIR